MKQYLIIFTLLFNFSLKARADLFGADLPLLAQIVTNTLYTMYELQRQSELMDDQMKGIKDKIYRIQTINEMVQPSQWDKWKDPVEALNRIRIIYQTLPKQYRSEKSDLIEDELSKAMNLVATVSRDTKSTFKSGKELENRGLNVSPAVAEKLTASGMGTLISQQAQSQVLQSHMVIWTWPMNQLLPAVEQYDKLIPVAQELYKHTSTLAWQMLLPFFLLSCAIAYTSDLGISGAILTRLKRLVIVALLLVSFPTIAEFSQSIGVEVARSIDDMTGIDMVLEAASKKAESYSFNLTAILNLNNDLVMGTLSLISFIILIITRYFLLAFQHFYWLLIVVLAPFLILGSLFESASGITKNLFKNMFLVASWPVIWSILSAFLKALPFATIYTTSGDYVTAITLNLIIAVALLFSPFIAAQLCEGATLSVGDTLRKGTLKAVTMANPKTMMADLAMQKSIPGRGASAFKSRFKKGN